ncbi:MAG: hypothetical protein SFU98_19715 [Leptospiraceae bacterium]|nr:hypothetical protein [Leptospiraceae bacterium]
MKLYSIHFLFTIITLTQHQLVSKEILIENVKILDVSKNSFSNNKKIYVENGKITRIEESKSEKGKFLTPSFCDASVSFGYNSLGGVNSKEKAKLSARAFVAHGFTHVGSVTDLEYVNEIKKEIESGHIIGPEIISQKKPILFLTKEYPELPEKFYSIVKSEEEMKKEVEKQAKEGIKYIRIYHRYYEENLIHASSFLLFTLDNIAKRYGSRILVNTFADNISLLEATRAGVQFVESPVVTENLNFKEENFKEIRFIPYFGIYRNLMLSNYPDKMKKEFQRINSLDNFFKFNYANEAFESIKETQTEESQILDNEEVMRFWEKFPYSGERMILGSGSGHLYNFPGTSGIQELELIYESFQKKINIWKIASRNSCELLGRVGHEKIELGNEFNAILYNNNPLNSISELYRPEQVFFKGKLVFNNSK